MPGEDAVRLSLHGRAPLSGTSRTARAARSEAPWISPAPRSRCGHSPKNEFRSRRATSLSRRDRRSAGPDRHDGEAGRPRSGAGGAPVAVRGGGVSESVAKAPRAGIGGEKNRGISTFLLRRSGAIRAFATDLDKRRRHGPREGCRGPGGGRGGRPLTPRRALRTRKCSSNRRSRVQNAHLECKTRISTRRRPVAAVADRGDGPARTTRPPARAIMTILTHKLPFPVRKAS